MRVDRAEGVSSATETRERKLVDYRALTCRLGGTRNRFGPPDCFFVQLPLVKGFFASFSRQAGIHLSFRFVKCVLGVRSRAARGIVCLFHFLHEQLYFAISRLARFAWLSFRSFSQFSVSGFYFRAPARFNLFIQPVQSSIGPVSHFSDSALLKQPGEHRPIHRLGHQHFGLFDFWQLSHGAATIARSLRKVQRRKFTSPVQIALHGSI